MRATWAYSIVMFLLAGAAPAGAGGPLTLTRPELSDSSFTLLGDLPGGAVMSRATAVSADGSTVVGYSSSTGVDPNGGDEAFRWKNGQLMGLGSPTQGPGKFSRATGVNWDGSRVTGNSRPLSLDRPFLWENGALASVFFEESIAGQMADNGHFVVHSHYGPSIWSAVVVSSGGHLNIPMIQGGDPVQVGVRALGISSDGLAAFGKSSISGGQQRAIRWRYGEGSYSIPMLTGCTQNEITAISGIGDVAVGVCEAESLSPQVFRWSPGTGTLPFVGGIPAVAMSDDASVMISEDSIWDNSNGKRTIPSYFDSLGFAIQWSNVSRLVATDLTPNGRVMVGYIEWTDGTTEAWRAVIPEPAAALLLAPALLMLRRRGNRNLNNYGE